MFKKVRYGDDRSPAILVCQVPDDAQRVSTPISRKCRASALLPLRAEMLDGTPLADVTEFFSQHDRHFVYRLGELATVAEFCDDMREECKPGLHFFVTRREAREY